MSKVVGYARGSRGDPNTAGQLQRLKRAGAVRLFEDVDLGHGVKRPGLAELLAAARSGDTLVVVRLDRLGRSLAELLKTVRIVRERGLRLLSLDEEIDTGSHGGEMIFDAFEAVGHFERSLSKERGRDEKAVERAQGKLAGRRPIEEDKVAAATKLITDGVRPAVAARQLGIGRSTLYREIKRLGITRPGRNP